MNTFALEIWFDEAERCSFYTVRWENAENSETDRFSKSMKMTIIHTKSPLMSYFGSLPMPLGMYMEQPMISLIEPKTRRRRFLPNPKDGFRKLRRSAFIFLSGFIAIVFQHLSWSCLMEELRINGPIRKAMIFD